MPRVLITGANRGIGLAFAQAYAADGWDVIATARRPADADDLAALEPCCRIEPLDMEDDASLDAFAQRIGATPLDVLILNAGIGAEGFDSVAQTSRGTWERAIVVNTYAPVRLAALLRDNVAASTQRKIVGISSLAASVGAYAVPGQYAYRASKAALNMLVRTLSVEWRALGITCLLLRPGRVRTRMTGFEGDLDAAESVRGMRAAIDEASLATSGSFIGYDGVQVPW